PVEYRLRLGLGEVEREALLVAGFEQPGEIVLAGWIAWQVRQIAIGVTGAGRLDLDDVSAEIRQHGRGSGRSDEARTVQNLEPCKNAFFHRGVAPSLLLFPPAGISAAASWEH